MITGLSPRCLQRYIAHVKASRRPSVVGKKLGQRSAKSEAVRAFLDHYASMHDYSPNETNKSNNMTIVSRKGLLALCFDYAR